MCGHNIIRGLHELNTPTLKKVKRCSTDTRKIEPMKMKTKKSILQFFSSSFLLVYVCVEREREREHTSPQCV